MRPIQIVLLAILVSSLFIYFVRLRSKLLDRLILLVLVVVGVVMVLMPDWTTSIAQLMGVGRGVDLVIYLCLLGVGFACLLLMSQIRRLEHMVTELTRHIAMREALAPNSAERVVVGSDAVAGMD